jgi:hypothetical protein
MSFFDIFVSKNILLEDIGIPSKQILEQISIVEINKNEYYPKKIKYDNGVLIYKIKKNKI